MFYEKSNFRPEQTEERTIVGGDRCLLERDLKIAGLVKRAAMMVVSKTETNAYLLILTQVNIMKKGWMLVKGEFWIRNFDLILSWRAFLMIEVILR